MLAKVSGVFRLTRDVELRYTQSGVAIVTLGLVNSEKFTSNGEQKENVCFVDASLFGRPAEVANQYLRKGSQIFIVADLMFDPWMDKDGQKRSKHKLKINSFEMLGSPQTSSSGRYDDNTPQPQPSRDYSNQPVPVAHENIPKADEIPSIDIDEDSIPF